MGKSKEWSNRNGSGRSGYGGKKSNPPRLGKPADMGKNTDVPSTTPDVKDASKSVVSRQTGKSSTSTSKKAAEKQKRIYEIQGIDVSSKNDRAMAMAEFNMLQDKAQLHYSDFAAQEVHYDKLNDPGVAERLKQANDAYTMSMFMNCVSPLQSGVTPGTLFQAWFSYKMIKTINPTMDMDMSRMCANLRQDLAPMYDELRRQHPIAGKIVSPLMSSLDGYLTAESVDKFTKSINRSMERGTLDDMILTPKQLAALKVGFMEQYYVDMRSGARPMDELDRDYQTALEHVNIIANNSGYDMAVVAAEERYLVGIKMHADPKYACMFRETSDLYGSHPVLDGDGTWSGKFETPDHHPYTVGGDASTGAFTVRRPMTTDDAMDHFDKNMDDHAKQIGSMYAWLNSDECQFGRVTKARVRRQLDEYVSEYRQNLCRQLVDDGSMRTAGRASDYVKKGFDDVVEETKDRGALSTDCQTLQMEMRRIVTKEVLAKTGIPVTEETITAVEGNRKCVALDPLADYARIRAGQHGDKGFRMEGCEIARQMRDNYLMDMSPEEITRLMIHAGTNIQQGIMAQGHANVLRNGKPFEFVENLAPAVHDPTTIPDKTETGAFPPAPIPDDLLDDDGKDDSQDDGPGLGD